MDERSGEDSWAQEQELVRHVARKIRTDDPEELQAELTRKLIELKRKPKPGIVNEEAYLRICLRRHALNWIRDRQRREARKINPLARPVGRDDEQTLEDRLAEPRTDYDSRLAVDAVLTELTAEQRRLWALLAGGQVTQSQAARHLGIHRNTVRRWLAEIKSVLTKHGFDG